jgi:hypothetical protein
MGEIRTVTTLKRKREEIAASIKLYEKQLITIGLEDLVRQGRLVDLPTRNDETSTQ